MSLCHTHTHTVSSASHRPLHNSCPVGRPGVFRGPGQPGDPLVLSDCISCNVGKRLEPTISLCSRRCLRAGSNKSHKPPISACCTPAGRLQTAAETFPTSLRVENLTNVTYVHLKTAWMKLFGLLVFHSFLFSFQNELLVFQNELLVYYYSLQWNCRLKTTANLCCRMQNTCSADRQMLTLRGVVKRDLSQSQCLADVHHLKTTNNFDWML